MLQVLLSYDGKSAIFNLPHNPLEIEKYNLSIGRLQSYDNIFLMDDDEPGQLQVKLIAETPIDNHLQLLFPNDARLSTINTVCGLFYNLPIEKQIDLTHSMADGHIRDEKELLNAIKDIKSADAHKLPAIIFSRVKLYTDTEDSCEFFMGGVPESDEDFEEHPGFEDFVEQISTTDTKEITAYVTTFTEGDGDPLPASQTDIERIYNVIADVDLDIITGWNKTGEDSFTFDYDIDELFNMKGIE